MPKVREDGQVTEMHHIVSFDIDKMPEAGLHQYDGTHQTLATGIKRTKVPVKDGRSQGAFIKSSAMMKGLVENPDAVFYSLEDVAKHNKEDDCWTVYEGRVYDITQYAKVHPGQRKIYLGKGKDCTELFKQYHSWVNCKYILGKY